MNAIALTISDIAIHQDSFGRFSLNDLHKASGGQNKHKPNLWLTNQQTQELIAELSKDEAILKAGIPAFSSIQGRNGGTYAVKELVYAYAMWISAKFHIAVIRAYDALVNQQYKPSNTYEGFVLTKEQANDIYNRVFSIAGDDNSIKMALWRGLHADFWVNSYKEIPATQYQEACDWLETKRQEYRNGAVMLYLSNVELGEKIQAEAKLLYGEWIEKVRRRSFKNTGEVVDYLRSEGYVVMKDSDYISQCTKILVNGLHETQKAMRGKGSN